MLFLSNERELAKLIFSANERGLIKLVLSPNERGMAKLALSPKERGVAKLTHMPSSGSEFFQSLRCTMNNLVLINSPVIEEDLVIHALNDICSEFREIVARIQDRET